MAVDGGHGLESGHGMAYKFGGASGSESGYGAGPKYGGVTGGAGNGHGSDVNSGSGPRYRQSGTGKSRYTALMTGYYRKSHKKFDHKTRACIQQCAFDFAEDDLLNEHLLDLCINKCIHGRRINNSNFGGRLGCKSDGEICEQISPGISASKECCSGECVYSEFNPSDLTPVHRCKWTD